MTTRPLTRVFVYGSLMRGGVWHHMLAGAEPLGDALTSARYALRDRGEYPALVEEGGCAVRGELYAVDAATLAGLDRLEEVPTLYLRRPVILADGSQAEAWVMPPERVVGAPVVPSGDWRRR